MFGFPRADLTTLMRVDIDSGLAQHTVITEIKEKMNEVKSHSFVDIVKQKWKKWKAKLMLSRH